MSAGEIISGVLIILAVLTILCGIIGLLIVLIQAIKYYNDPVHKDQGWEGWPFL